MDSALLPDCDDPAALLAAVAAARVMADRAEARILQAAAVWVDQHPPAEPGLGAWRVLPAGARPGPDEDGDPAFGLPAPAWDSIAELAARQGLRAGQGRDQVLEALEIRHRLPRLWAAVCGGRVQAWRARRIARATLFESVQVAGWVDAHATAVAHSIGAVGLDRIVDEARLRFHPAERERDLRERLDARFVKLFDHITHHGVAELAIRADLADAVHFEAAVATIATRLGVEGDPDSLEVRRSKAIGILADPPLAAYYLASPHDESTPADESTPVKPTPRPREVVLHAHLSLDALAGLDPTARLERGDQPILAELVRQWCGNPHAQVTVVPVRDLATHHHSSAYRPSEALQGQVEELHRTCVFPFCQRPAHRCDKDHCVPHAEGGATCSCNIAPLCRHHHRIKTHTTWTYRPLEPGILHWTSPHGLHYLRDRTGTRPLDTPTTGPPSHPPPTATTGCFHAPPAA